MAEALGTVASIIAVLGLAKSAVSLLRDIKDASAQCKTLIAEISFTRGLLEGLKDTISDLDAARSWTQTIQLLAQTDGPISCLEKVLRTLNDKLEGQASSSRSKKIMRSLLWPFDKGESEEILRSIERQKLSLLLAIENNHIRLAMAIREDTKQNGQNLQSLQEDLTQVIQGVSKIGLSIEDHLSLDILSWISPLNARTAHDQIYRSLVPDTGEWLLGMPAFKAWVAGDLKTLFCPGIPGAGKSSLTSQIIHYMETRANLPPESQSVAWIYCDYRESGVQNVLLFIASLLKQYLQNIRPIPSGVRDLYNSHGKGEISLTLSEARNLLQSIVAGRQRCFVIVDALDECTESDGTREQLLSELRALKPPISLLVTSRPILSIETMLSEATILQIVPQKEDLEIYIDRRLSTETKLHKIVQADQLLQQEIKDTLVAKNQGIFLMTKLHLDALAKKAKHSKKALRDALANLPLDLDKTYEDAMARISAQEEEDAHLAVQVLSWVLMSFRRMTVRELQEALAVQSDYEENDEESLIDPEFFISVCGGLLVLDRGGYVDWISFVHLTTEEFFERNTEKYFPQADIHISSICLKQLTKRSINLKKLTRSPETAMNEFTEYAVRYAVLHVNASSEPGLFTAIMSLWESDHLGTIRQAFDYLTSDGTTLTDHEEKTLIHPYSKFTRLQLAVMFNLDMEAEEMIGEGFIEDSFGVPDTVRLGLPILVRFSEAQIPVVCIAIHNRNFQILELLLDAGARLDVVMIDRKGSTLTALECAIAREDQEMVQFLLRRSPTLTDYRPIKGRTALHFAVSSQLHELASYLMSDIVGLSVDEKDEDGQTPLHHLVKAEPEPQSRNLMPTFQSLLRASATINAYDIKGKTPLDYCRKIWYRSNQSYELYDALVSQGAIESWGKKLQLALTSGLQAEAQRLLDKNANIHALPESMQHCLLRLLLSRQLVIPPDAESVIRLECSLAGTLIDLGATIQSLERGETDLHWIINHLGGLRRQFGKRSMRYEMAKRTHLHVLNKLISTVDNVDVKFRGETPLYLASSNDQPEIVEMLLSRGADDSIGSPFDRPIDVAARYCRPRVVEILLARRPSLPPSLVDQVQSAMPWFFEDPLTFPRDRHETLWLLCAYSGLDFPRSDDARRLQQRQARVEEIEERQARVRLQEQQAANIDPNKMTASRGSSANTQIVACEVIGCVQIFASDDDMTRHRQLHPYCPQCRSYYAERSLEEHGNRHHN